MMTNVNFIFNDDQITDLSLCDAKRLHNYLNIEEGMIYDQPTDGYATSGDPNLFYDYGFLIDAISS
jgi:hypothetical protein